MENKLNTGKKLLSPIAMCVCGLMIAFAPNLSFAAPPDVDCMKLSDTDSRRFYDLSAKSAQAAQAKQLDEALALAREATSICNTDAYTMLTLGRIYELTNDCPNAYYLYDNLMKRSDDYQKENAYVYKEVKKHLKNVKSKCGDVVTLEITCEMSNVQLAASGLGDLSNIDCPFYGKVKPGSYSFIASRDGYQPYKTTVTVSSDSESIVRIPNLKEKTRTGRVRISCPRGASKFILVSPDGSSDEYVCPYELELPIGSYKVKLGGASDSELSSFDIVGEKTVIHSIPNTAKTNCSATPASHSQFPFAAAVLALLAGLGVGVSRWRKSE